MEAKYRKRLNRAILQVLRQALRISLSNPSMGMFLLKTLFRQKKAAHIRENWEARGIHVPPFLIASVTRKCNLNCTGCYAHAQPRSACLEMSVERFGELMDEARELGFAFALLAGGEPLKRPEILRITETHPEIIFPLFTNGMLLSDPMSDRLGKQKNVVPVLSLEGHQRETDARRGQGVYDNLLRAMKTMKMRRIFNRLFISFPGDEQYYGGCLAAGRGFVHVGPDGALEPCPFAPYSDINLEHASLKQGLASVFLNEIRESDEHLKETESGGALWNKRDWVRSLLLKSRTKIA